MNIQISTILSMTMTLFLLSSYHKCVAFSSITPIIPITRRMQTMAVAVAAEAATTTIYDTVDLQMVDFSSTDDSAKEEDVPVVLLHGLLGSKRNFATLGSSLAMQLQKKRRVVGVDLRNHGENNHDWRDEMSYTEMAMDVLAFMDRENFNKVVLVGHSMGGKVAKALALAEPSRVDGLVVLDIAPVTYTVQDLHWKAVQDIIVALATLQLEVGQTKRDVDKALRISVEDPALRAFVLTNLDMTNEKQGPKWKINMNAIHSQLETIAGFDIPKEEENPQYQGDTFFIHGGSSKFVRHSYMPTIARYFPNHMLTTIRGAGHWVHAEAPDDTLALLKQYLDR